MKNIVLSGSMKAKDELIGWNIKTLKGNLSSLMEK